LSKVFIGTPTRERIEFSIPSAELIANTTQYLIAPLNGFFKEMRLVVNKAVTTGGTVTPSTVPAVFNAEGGLDQTSFAGTVTGDTLIAGSGSLGAVAGLQATVPNGATVGTLFTETATVDDPSTAVIKGQVIELALSGFATAGELNGYLEFDTESHSG
jgi:hypothetical protein